MNDQHDDQARTLRRLMQQRQAQWGGDDRLDPGLPKCKVITVASGKGGVGKSSLVANLGSLLARSGSRVLVVDGDFGLANLDILLGVQAQATLEQVLDGEASLQDAVVGVEPNLWLLPAAAGLFHLRRSHSETRMRLARLLSDCPWEMDYILVDAGAGIQENVLSLHHASFESVIILTPEPTSLTDAYGLVKLLRREVGVSQVSVISNQVADGRDGQKVFQKLRDVASRFVDTRMTYLGHVVRDENFTQSVMKRKILLDLNPGAAGVQCLELVAKTLRHKLGERLEDHVPGVSQQRGQFAVSGKLISARANSRFMDEPAHRAPGNTAGFWTTLLGEVKA